MTLRFANLASLPRRLVAARPGSSARGFTVIEAVVSLALTTLFLLLAGQLLQDTQRASLATRRQALDPTPQHIAQQLRRDIHGARATVRLRGSAGALFLLLAGQLLQDTQRAALATRRQALDPTPQHIAQQLRYDVHRARATVRLRGSAGALWSRGPLTLRLPDGGSVRYEKTADQVARSLIDAKGASAGERALLRGVVSWRWLQLSSDLVEVEIGFRRRPDGEALRRSIPQPRSAIETMRMRIAMRSAPGRSSW